MARNDHFSGMKKMDIEKALKAHGNNVTLIPM